MHDFIARLSELKNLVTELGERRDLSHPIKFFLLSSYYNNTATSTKFNSYETLIKSH
jgi:hypothetical protein